MRSITQHVQELQAISGLAIAFLTVILISVTALYTRANWDTMKLMSADVRSRLRPIPRVGIQPPFIPDQKWHFSIRSENAPMVLSGIEVRFLAAPKKDSVHFLPFKGEVVHPSTALEIDIPIKPASVSETWTVELFYRDISGFLHYATKFDKNGFVGNARPVDPSTLWFRFWNFFSLRRAKAVLRD